MDIWQTADPDRPGNTGWLGRWLDSVGGDPRLAVSFEPVLPPLLAGELSSGAAVPVTGRSIAPVFRPQPLPRSPNRPQGSPRCRPEPRPASPTWSRSTR